MGFGCVWVFKGGEAGFPPLLNRIYTVMAALPAVLPLAIHHLLRSRARLQAAGQCCSS